MKREKRWVVWNKEKVQGRITKVPYSAKTTGPASSTDPETWTDYATAKKAAAVFDGVGIVFTPEQKLLGIDIDHVLKDGAVVGPKATEILRLIEVADTYTEISPSGDGLHLYLQLSDPLSLEETGNRKAPYEAYTSGRYFTWTEVSFHKRAKKVRTVSPEEALSILGVIGYPWKAPAERQMAKDILEGSLFTDEELLDRMFRSKNGEAIKALYEGDTSTYDKDGSRADAALLSHLAFWSRKDAAQMERIWLASPIGQRKKTQDPKNRKNYVLRSIDGAIKTTKETYRAPVDAAAGIDFLFTINSQKDKVYTQNTENISRILRHHEAFAGRFRFDEFTNVFEIQKGGKWVPFEDSDAITIQTDISILFPFFQKVGKDMVYDAIVLVSKENRYDSALSFIQGLVWDQEKRLETWLTHTYGVADDIYHNAVGANWMKGLVKRLVQPGCKFDYVLVLEGEQGAKKSTSLHILGAIPGLSLHVETTMSTDSKDFFMQMQGKAIIEFSEGETLNRTEVKKMKAIITTQSDKYRAPYERVSKDYPRRCVFAMTTNQEEYLKDETGNRRWLPVRVLKDEADIAWLEANRDQLFAEAYARVMAGETVYEFPKEETIAQQEARRISDPNEDRIIEWYWDEHFMTDSARATGISVQQVFVGALGGMSSSMKKYEEMQITDVLKRVLKLTRVRRSYGGSQRWVWIPDDSLVIGNMAAPMVPAGEIEDDPFSAESLNEIDP